MLKTPGYRWFFIIIVFVIVILNAVFWGRKKESTHVDENFSYHFVCETDYPSINAIRDNQTYMNNWHDKDYFHRYYVVDKDESFDIAGTINAVKHDVHPPLYYVLLELFISIFSVGRYTKWSGILLNLIFLILSDMILYMLAVRCFRRRRYAYVAAALYGLSCGAVSMVMFMRMYAVLAFFTMLLAYSNLLIWKKQVCHENMRFHPEFLLFLSILSGALTQYYHLIYAFFSCAVFMVFLWLYKRYQYSVRYALVSLSAIAAYFIMWREVFL